jgi:hypothetical protein
LVRDSRRSNFTLLTSLLLVGVLFACSEKKSSKSSSASGDEEQTKVESLQPDSDVEATLSLDAGDEILTLAVNPNGSVSASSKSGAAYVFDPDSGDIEKVPSYFKFDPQVTTVLTVNKEFLWVISLSDETIGRNKLAPDQSKKFEISKVTVSDILDVAAATPVGASESQLYLITDDSLAVMTFSGSFINRKIVPLPDGKLSKNEHIVGAGPLGEGDSTAEYWVLTNKRLLRFSGTLWSEKSIVLQAKGDEMNLATLYFEKNDSETEDAAYGLLNSDLLVGLKRGQVEIASEGKAKVKKNNVDKKDSDEDQKADDEEEQ